MSITDLTNPTAVQEQYLSLLKQGQDAVVDFVRTAAELVQPLVQPLVKDLPAASSLPFADQLPSPDAAVKGAFDFAQQILAAEREFANQLVGVLTGSQD